jgi:hypothetical protein
MNCDYAEQNKPSTNGHQKAEVILEIIKRSVMIMKVQASRLEERLKQHDNEFQEVA